VSERTRDLLRFYEESRIKDQLKFYRGRREQFDRATGQGLAVSATLLGFASAAGALAGTAVGWVEGWSALAAILPAMSTGLAAYLALYAFDQQSKIYSDAMRAVQAATRSLPDPNAPQNGQSPEENIADLVRRVEGVLREEQGQWGQLTSRIHIDDQTKA
jgi:SMODS and SLOG-associating 2TM effector domain 1